MKAIQFFAITALGAALFASCSNQEELATGSYPSDNLIRVTAGVNNDMTRGDEATTALTKDFSLTVVNQTNDKYSYANEIFSLNSNHEWTCSNKLLWQNLTTPVEIVALYPATAASTFSGVYSKEDKSYGTITYSVNSDQSKTDDANNDLLLYHNASFVPKNDLEDGKLDIQFNHAFCRVDIEVTIGSEFNANNGLAENPIQGISVGGTKIAAEIGFSETADPTFTAKGDATSITPTPGKFTPAASATEQAVARYSCIVIPQTTALKVLLHTSDREFEWTGSQMELESGKQYTLQLNMKKSATARKFILRERK